MFFEKHIAGIVEVEPHSSAKCPTDLLFATRRTLGNATRIGEIRPCPVSANDTKALRAVFRHDNLKIADATAYLRDILGVPLKQSGEIKVVFIEHSLARLVAVQHRLKERGGFPLRIEAASA